MTTPSYVSVIAALLEQEQVQEQVQQQQPAAYCIELSNSCEYILKV